MTETQSNRKRIRGLVVLFVLVSAVLLLVTAGAAAVYAQEAPPGAPAGGVMSAPVVIRWDLSIAISLSIGLPCLGAGFAVARVGAAAIGAATEKPELLTRSLIFVALAEGIAIYGFLVALLLYIKF